jgi:hypothetical protein
MAYVTAQRAMPAYRHRKSPKKFTQHQLFALLVLKEFFKTDYRGISEIVKDSSDLRKILELRFRDEIPHWTTLQKTAHRMLKDGGANLLLSETVRIAQDMKVLRKTVLLAALDSTGLESHYTSSYFVKRKAKGGATEQRTTYIRVPKVGIVADCKHHFVLAGVPSWGPSPDIIHFEKAVIQATNRTTIRTLLADAGYDSEKAHRLAREELGVRTVIPARIGRPTNKLPSGKYRKIMATRFSTNVYGQRWQVETLNAMLKRALCSFLRARSYWSQMRELMMRLITFNILVLR